MLTHFHRDSFSGNGRFTFIGKGSMGAKASGLANIQDVLRKIAPSFDPAIRIEIPFFTVVGTDFFDLFLQQNDLLKMAASPGKDADITLAFHRAKLPAELVSDLRAFVAQVRAPLAVRSSSLLEDSLHEPFAGVYGTKMIPNNQPNADGRLLALADAIKYVYASTFLAKARSYLQAVGRASHEEKMAVIIQEVVGTRHNDRFYPHISGVARSFNFYPTGLARPEDGVVGLALGLGKIIVEDGVAWYYSPAYPQANPPYDSVQELLEQSQKEFWALDMARTRKPSSTHEIEHVKKYSLSEAEHDGTLALIASTYKAEDERIVMGITEPGPRLINFAQMLKADLLPLNELLKELLSRSENVLGTMVDIEFALTLPIPRAFPARFGFLQVRPMVISRSLVEVGPEDLLNENVLVASESCLGNGTIDTVRDIVYVKPQTFETRRTQAIARELEQLNADLLAGGLPYALIGFGRWGTTDPSAGIPVNFGQVSGAKAIVETTLPDLNTMLSQGSHFFRNLMSLKILYFSVSHTEKYRIDWEWLDRQKTMAETEFARHVRLDRPLEIRVDGRSGRGVILR